jgi:transposase
MRNKTKIKAWLCNAELKKWVKKAADLKQYKRRLTIKLSQIQKLRNDDIAEILDVSAQTIWNWLHRYNKLGPERFDFKVRGGRRRQILSLKQEKLLFAKFKKQMKSGVIDSVADFKPELEKAARRKVSSQYAYKLFYRLGWEGK